MSNEPTTETAIKSSETTSELAKRVGFEISPEEITKLGKRLNITEIDNRETRDEVAKGVTKCVDIRTTIEKYRVELNKKPLQACRDINYVAKVLTEQVLEHETPAKKLRNDWDAERKAERDAKKELEANRKAEIERCLDVIRNTAVAAARFKTSAEVRETMTKLHEYVPAETDFMERLADADALKLETMAELDSILTGKVEDEAEAKRLAEQKLQQDAEAKRQKEESDRLDAERKKQEAEAEVRRKEQKSEDDRREEKRVADQKKLDDEAEERRRLQRAEDEQRQKDQAAEQKKIDDQRAEVDRKQKEVDEEAERQRQEKEAAEQARQRRI